MNGQPSAVERAATEQAQKRQRVAQVYDGPTAVDHTAETDERPDADDVVKGHGPIGDAIARHNAHAPTPHRPGRQLVNGPTSENTALITTRQGVAAPGAPRLDADRAECSTTPDSGSGFPGRVGGDRAQTPTPGPGVAESATKAVRDGATGQFTHPAGQPGGLVTVDLGSASDAAALFRRPTVQLPGRAANGASTGQPNTSNNERSGS